MSVMCMEELASSKSSSVEHKNCSYVDPGDEGLSRITGHQLVQCDQWIFLLLFVCLLHPMVWCQGQHLRDALCFTFTSPCGKPLWLWNTLPSPEKKKKSQKLRVFRWTGGRQPYIQKKNEVINLLDDQIFPSINLVLPRGQRQDSSS